MSSETFASSRDAFNWCLEKGIISQRVADVLKVLVEGGAMNQTVAHTAVVRATGNVALQKYSVSPRFAVLERMGLIREIGRNPCPVTGRMTMFYEATCARPRMTEAEAMNAARSRETRAQLQAELRELREEARQLRELLNIRSASHAERERLIRQAPAQVQTNLFPS